MHVRRCDRCGKDIESFSGRLFKMRKYYYRASFEEVPGKEWRYDLCRKCAEMIEAAIKYGPKEG